MFDIINAINNYTSKHSCKLDKKGKVLHGALGGPSDWTVSESISLDYFHKE